MCSLLEIQVNLGYTILVGFGSVGLARNLECHVLVLDGLVVGIKQLHIEEAF